MLLINCHLVSPGVEIIGASVRVEAGLIVEILPSGAAAHAGETVIDLEGRMLMPGFIDAHCHGRNNFDFCDASAEGVAVMAEGKLSEGVTTLLPTTLTLSEEALAAALAAVAGHDPAHGCRMPAVHLEGPFINPKCIGAQNPDYVRPIDIAEIDRLNAIYPVRKVTFAVELPGGAEFTAALRQRGMVPSCTHSAAKYPEFLAAYRAGLRCLSHFCNQMTPLHHRDIGLVGAGLLHDEVFVELICDKLHIAPEMIALVFKVKGADHVQLISDAMRASGMPDGEYTLGGLPVVVAGGAARLREGGALAGSTLQISTALKNVAEITGLPLCEVVKSATSTPATALGLSGFGRIEPGYAADFAVLDENFSVCMTIVGGEIRFQR